MLNGSKIAQIIKENKMTIKEASKEIGISYNNLSSIVNNKANSNKSSEMKILSYFQNKFNVMPDELYKRIESPINIRMKPIAPLSGNEKSIIREDLVKYEKLITLLNWEDQNLYTYDSYITEMIWDLYTQPYEDITLFDYTQRRQVFFDELAKYKISNPYDAINFLLSEKIQNLFARFMYIGYDSGHEVIKIAENLGIKILFVSLKSSKVLSASTTILDGKAFTQEPCIIINKNSCKSPENILFNIAKELYYVLFKKNEYTLISDYSLEIENQNSSGNIFAREILFNTESVADYINTNLESLIYYFPHGSNGYNYELTQFAEYGWIHLICEIKRHYRISYKNIISFLFDTNFQNLKEITTEENFNEYFINAINEYNNKFAEPAYPLLDGEPMVKPFDYTWDHLSICLNSLKSEKDKNDSFEKIYEEYKDFFICL